MADDRFGEIRINPGSSSEVKGPDVPLASSGQTEQQVLPEQPDIHAADSEAKKKRPPRQRIPQHKISAPSRRTIAWLSIIPLLVILYGVSSYFFVPMVIKTVLLPKFSEFAERPVDVGRILFSPFNLELLVHDVSVGPVSGDKTGKKLFAFETARVQFSPARILDGKLLCRQVEVDGISINVVRHEDTQVNLNTLYELFLSLLSGQDVKYWPSWIVLDELQISSGKVQVDDRLAKKVFTIEQIQFFLPSADTRERDNAALPKLSAVIDSSPFEINAVRFQNQSGAWRTGFSFEFKNVIMEKFKELIPLPATGLLLTEGEADIALDIILPEKQHGPEGIVIEGEANLRNIKWSDVGEQAKLTLPEARIVYHIVPSDKRIRFTSVDFHEPELNLFGKRESARREPLDSFVYFYTLLEKLFNADEILEVESFLWNNGKIKVSSNSSSGKKTEWNDIVFTMSGFTTAGHRRAHPSATDPPSYSFRASDISINPTTEILSEGQLNHEAILKGKLEMSGLDLEQYSTLLPKSEIVIQKGKSNISFHYEYGGHPSKESGNAASLTKMYGGTFKTAGYVLVRNGKKAIVGDMMECRDFYLDLSSKTVVCDQLELLKSNINADMLFSAEVTRKAGSTDNWQYLVNDLQVNSSILRASLKGFSAGEKSVSLDMHDMTLEGRSLHSEKVTDNVRASLRIGKKGRLNVSGSYSSLTNQGNMQIDIQDMDLSLLQPYYSSWFIPKVNSGMFGASGSLKLPERDFTGKMQISDLDAGDENSARIKWRQAFSDNCIYRSADPMVFELNNVVVQKPVVTPGLSGGERPISKYIRLKDNVLPPSVRIGSVRIVDGSYAMAEPIIYSGYQPQLENINGMFYPADATDQKFSLTGKINGQNNFALDGSGSLNSILSYHLDVQNFSLLPFDSVLKEKAGFSSTKALASWKQEMVMDDNIANVTAKITVQDVFPNPDSALFPTLSLIIQDDNHLELEMDGQYSDDRPQPFLFEQLINKLRHLEVKTAISPQLVLKSELPALDLVAKVTFAPGSALLDETMALSLSDYKELLKVRPFILMSLQGQYDPVADGEVLQAELQQIADIERDAENKRRAFEKVKILQREKKRLKELEAGTAGVVTEVITPDELTTDLQPLPRKKVQLDHAKLQDLARQRTQVLQNYLVRHLQLDPLRIQIDTKILKGSANVQIGILPYISTEVNKENDDS